MTAIRLYLMSLKRTSHSSQLPIYTPKTTSIEWYKKARQTCSEKTKSLMPVRPIAAEENRIPIPAPAIHVVYMTA